MNQRLLSFLWSFLLLVAVSSAAVQAQESGWPRTLPLGAGSVTIYPLQADHLNGDISHFRAALAYRKTADSTTVFGAAWFESRVEIDRENGIVHPLDLKVTNTRFPAGTDDVQDEIAAAFAQQAPGWNLDFPLSQFESSIETAQEEAKSAQSISTAPPTILYRDHPALLVNIDGKPVFRSIENSNYQAVINTPYPLIFDGKTFYLNAAQGAWYRANSATGPYRFDTNPPADLVAMVEASAKTSERPAASEKVTAANAPEIVVATTPSELIVTEGAAEFVPLADDLLVLDNSADDVFMHISTQQYYLVLAGRWYHSPSLNGPWTYRAADALPVAFTNIPGNSEQADSRVYVPGTDEAEEAVLDAQIPVTATVARGPVDLDVSYDGEPSFEPVQGTSLQYADNTASTVIESDRTYYLVEDGVWYVSASPNGPWEVSDYRPEEVAAIAPESPVYNVKYVYVYDSTPEYVYVGYTPGYTGSYVYGNSIVYGTGYYYDPWISSSYYYPRYTTWGFNVGYNPWTGWGFGLSWGWGPFYAGFYSGGYWHQDQYWGGGGYGYWGPCGYRPRWGYDNDYGYGGHGHDYWGNDGHHGGNNGGGWDGNDHGDWGNGGNDGGGHGGGNWGGRGQGDFAAGDSRNANLRVRNANLYRDRDQKARVAGIGDRVSGRVTDRPGDLASRTGGASRDLARNSANPAGRREKLNAPGQDTTAAAKGGLNRSDLVRVSDLRAKAQKRDAMLGADRGKLFADNNRAEGRSGLAPLERSAANSAARAPSKGAMGRTHTTPQNANGIRNMKPGGNATLRNATTRGTMDRRTMDSIGRPTASAQTRPSAPAQSARGSRAPFLSAANTPQERSAPQQRPALQQRGAPRQLSAPQQRSAPRQLSAPQQRSAPRQLSAPQQRSSAPQQRSAPQLSSAPRQFTAPQQQRSAPQERSAPQKRSAPQQQSAPQQRSAPRQSSAPQQRSAPSGSGWNGSGRKHSG